MGKLTLEERRKLTADYAKLRIKQLKDPDLLKRRPYWKYISNATMVAPCHTEWDGLVLHHTDNWWMNHFPPNGPDCRCRVTAVRPEEYTGHVAPSD